MAAGGTAEEKARAGRRCPICGKPTVEEFSPFCSKRCAEIDLHRWLTGRYAIPASQDDEPTDGSGADHDEEN